MPPDFLLRPPSENQIAFIDEQRNLSEEAIFGETEDIDISDGEVTYEGWVYFDSVSSKQCIWEHYTDDNNLARLFFEGGNGDVLRLSLRSSGSYFLNATGTTTLSATTWYHIAVTRSTSGDWETYINGTKDNGASGSESSALDTSGMAFYLGVDFWNVDRFLDLIESISEKSKTKFVVVTHNRLTMSRMHRLYGVTMAEQGVSQLVSVDLQKAEELVA